jgi:hypothetical protein
MIIDKLSNTPLTNSQITKRAQYEIELKYDKITEANLNRKLQGAALGLYTLTTAEQAELTQYKTDLEAIRAEAHQALIDNQDLINVIEYEKAKQRLAQYKLETGKPSKPIYEKQPDPKTGLMIDVKIGMTTEILPVDMTATRYATNATTNKTTSKLITNPIIIKDRAERVLADKTVKAVTPKILSDYKLRL